MKCNSIDDSKGNIVDLEESHKYGNLRNSTERFLLVVTELYWKNP